MAIDASWGNSTSNVYCDLTNCNSYLTTALYDYDAWTDATTAQREAVLIQATHDIDSRNWCGDRFYYYQNLAWPRTLFGESPWPWGNTSLTAMESDSEYVRAKERVMQACCEQAFYILDSLSGGVNEHIQNQALAITSYSEGVGPLSESFSYGRGGDVLCLKARGLLKPYKGQIRLMRG